MRQEFQSRTWHFKVEHCHLNHLMMVSQNLYTYRPIMCLWQASSKSMYAICNISSRSCSRNCWKYCCERKQKPHSSRSKLIIITEFQYYAIVSTHLRKWWEVGLMLQQIAQFKEARTQNLGNTSPLICLSFAGRSTWLVALTIAISNS